MSLLDPETGAHLYLILRRHRRGCERTGQPYLVGLADLEMLAAKAAKRGRVGTGGDAALVPATVAPYGRTNGSRKLLTQKEAAAELGVHPRTVRRWLDAGELSSVPIAGRRRIPRAALHNFPRSQPGNAELSGTEGGRPGSVDAGPPNLQDKELT